mgnify:CR=1 FL=1
MEDKSKNYSLKKRTSIFIGIVLILMGIGMILLGDTFTLFPSWLILTGIFFMILTALKVNPSLLLILLFITVYYLFSINREVVKRYQCDITVTPHQNKFYFIASNSNLKWIDYLFTWFTSKRIEINIIGDKVYYLNRGLPNSINYNTAFIANQGYTISQHIRGNYYFLVLVPLKISKEDIITNEKKDRLYTMTDSNNNLKLNRKLIEYKLDSIEKNGFQ